MWLQSPWHRLATFVKSHPLCCSLALSLLIYCHIYVHCKIYPSILNLKPVCHCIHIFLHVSQIQSLWNRSSMSWILIQLTYESALSINSGPLSWSQDQWEYKLWLPLKVCYCTTHDKQMQLSSPHFFNAALLPFPQWHPRKPESYSQNG